jgi:hypothetical protein
LKEKAKLDDTKERKAEGKIENVAKSFETLL